MILRKPTLPITIHDTTVDALDSLKPKLLFLQVTSQDVECLRRLAPYFDKYAEAITERHYELLFRLPEMKSLIEQHSTRKRLTETFIIYLRSIPHIAFDGEYVRTRERIGQVHSRIQLEPEWFLASFLRVYEFLVPLIVKDFRAGEAAQMTLALHRILMLDAQIVLEAYQAAYEYRIMDSNSKTMEMLIQMDGIHSLLQSADNSIHDALRIQSAAEQLTSSIEEVSSQTTDAATTTDCMVSALQENKSIVEQTIQGFEEMTEMFRDTRDRFENLQQSIQDLSDVVQLIDSVADQTHLLALNASIEAARAGEEGRGFAVVAGEVRKLSEQTKRSVHNVYEVIGNIQTLATSVQERTNKMSDQMEVQHDKNRSAFDQLEQMMRSVSEVGLTEDTIASIVEQQAAATQEITNNMAGIVKNTEVVMEMAKRTGEHIYTTSKTVESLRRSSLEWFNHMNDAQWIRIMKTDHLLWKWWTYNRLLGYDDSDPELMENYNQCRLGKWIQAQHEQKSSALVQSPKFQALVDRHREMHLLAGKAARQFDEGQLEEAIQSYKQLDDSSQQLLQQLDELKVWLESKSSAASS
ncbi:methyl-accepting chemotaxis protein [Paenibacillus profundus]|uniref:Methyl-accepting chemotaxis protein n=1 Tax=Paenibacillus profundus TaxID=1173085 RepID=A0ABS8YFA9_9BACL|nr:protoglobin domain-containing protein [Paenibacillus profundus]MCE5168742.1 methyl-accepting chemotaxis protein [Paenibacillus profundus]